MTTLRLIQKKSSKEGRKIDSTGSVHAAVKFLEKQDREKFYALHLDANLKLIGRELISQGSLTNSIVHPREVFKAAILNNSAQIILAHNHPSGDPEPSADDKAVTARLIEAGNLLGIPVIDHIIVARDAAYSFSSVAATLDYAQKTDSEGIKQLEAKFDRRSTMKEASNKMTRKESNTVIHKESKAKVDVKILDRLHEARTKLSFMTLAISDLWGSSHSQYGNETVFGCQLLMHDIEEDFATVHEALDPDAGIKNRGEE